MPWFSARLLHVILVDSGRPRLRHTFDESVVLLRCRDPLEAERRALVAGHTAEHEYRNTYGQRVRLAFVELVSVEALDRLVDGVEIASRLHTGRSPRPLKYDHVFQPERKRRRAVSMRRSAR